MKLRGFAAALGVAALVAGLPGSGVAETAPSCEWVAGDLHIHSTYSHDAYGPEEGIPPLQDAYTLGHSVTSQFLVASTRGLDFLAITDHNDIRSASDPGFGAFGVIPVRGYENSLKGHAQMLGANELFAGDSSTPSVQAMADALRAAGGIFQINHPAEGSVDHPTDADWGYGYDIVPDTVEVWNIPRLYQPPLPSASSNDDAIRYWEGWLDRGRRVGATGGSDNHYVATTAIQGGGQPTTWVCAQGTDERAVLEGLRKGRTFISHQPPAYEGPQIFLEGDADGDGTFDSIVGDVVPPGSSLRARVVGAPGSMLRIVTNGGQQSGELVPVTSPDFVHGFTLPEDKTWVRAEIFEPDAKDERAQACNDVFGSQTTYCRNALLVLAMTSALYLQEPDVQPDRSTTLTYDGDTSAQAGSMATFAATLLGADGPIPDAVVRFDYRGGTYQATTDDDGRATTTVRIVGPPGTYELTTSFAGDAEHDPSSDSDTFTVESGRP